MWLPMGMGTSRNRGAAVSEESGLNIELRIILRTRMVCSVATLVDGMRRWPYKVVLSLLHIGQIQLEMPKCSAF